MEGIYFFGEHTRWNLGWSNPNQAGVFVAMWIPWLWALGRWVSRARNKEGTGGCLHALRRDAAATVVLASELVLWFLLCKTYSRGALVAVGISGVILLGWCYLRDRRYRGIGLISVRLAAIGVLLFATGFFSRIDPRFVSQDASAGNRLVLWKGGLQMIAASPWQGWGKGQSGIGFAHWFQPLDATEKYAGMVNSYLHVGVEYGLPVLVVVMTPAMVMCLLARKTSGANNSGMNILYDVDVSQWRYYALIAAGCSMLVFLIANAFSTLWIFWNLWWIPAVDGLVILILSFLVLKWRFFGTAGRLLGVAWVMVVIVSTCLYLAGKFIAGPVRVTFHDDGNVTVSTPGKKEGSLLFFPEPSVLGDEWGKEIRKLVMEPELKKLEIEVVAPKNEQAIGVKGDGTQVIVACGRRFAAGISALKVYPNAHLILLHPLGTPVIPEGLNGRVSVVLPMLDTRNAGRIWRTASKKNGWSCTISPGVGQDVRLALPQVLIDSM